MHIRPFVLPALASAVLVASLTALLVPPTTPEAPEPAPARPVAATTPAARPSTPSQVVAVPRARIDALLSDLDSVSRLGRAVLHRGPDGEFDGFRVSGIRHGTLGDDLGLRNGDVIHAVSTHPLTSIADAMQAYQALQDAQQFDVELTRDGAPHALRFVVEG